MFETRKQHTHQIIITQLRSTNKMRNNEPTELRTQQRELSKQRQTSTRNTHQFDLYRYSEPDNEPMELQAQQGEHMRTEQGVHTRRIDRAASRQPNK